MGMHGTRAHEAQPRQWRQWRQWGRAASAGLGLALATFGKAGRARAPPSSLPRRPGLLTSEWKLIEPPEPLGVQTGACRSLLASRRDRDVNIENAVMLVSTGARPSWP
jgi:hypothetical protein